MPRERFKITNADGTPKLCKFCGEPVWWDVIGTRWYNVGGESLHSTTCTRSTKHYSGLTLDAAEARRQRRQRRPR